MQSSPMCRRTNILWLTIDFVHYSLFTMSSYHVIMFERRGESFNRKYIVFNLPFECHKCFHSAIVAPHTCGGVMMCLCVNCVACIIEKESQPANDFHVLSFFSFPTFVHFSLCSGCLFEWFKIHCLYVTCRRCWVEGFTAVCGENKEQHNRQRMRRNDWNQLGCVGGLGGKSANSNKFSYFLLIHLRHDMREREEQKVYERKRFVVTV